MIDIHSHFFPLLNNEERSKLDESLPYLEVGENEGGFIMLSGERYRPVRRELWDPGHRVELLDKCGIDVQLICATPIMFGYDLPAREKQRAASYFNDQATQFCADSRGRLLPLCQVPLPEFDASCAELERAKAMGHVGVQIATHVGDFELDSDVIIAFLNHCARHEMGVLVHPWDMPTATRSKPYMLPWLVGMPAETHLAIMRLILSGAFERLDDKLNICFSHGGGNFAAQLGRADNAWRHRDIVREDCPELPSSYANRFYCDSIVFDKSALSLLTDTMSVGRVMFGTDFPFPLGDQSPGELVRTHPLLSLADREAILNENATKFFALEARLKPEHVRQSG